MLDANDPIEGPYRLEISSPGIDRPLVRRSDFHRYAGTSPAWRCSSPSTAAAVSAVNFSAPRATACAFAPKKRSGENPDVLLPIDDMMEARLVLTDELISESLRRSKRGGKLEERVAPAQATSTPTSHQHHNMAAAPEHDRRVNQRKGD